MLARGGKWSVARKQAGWSSGLPMFVVLPSVATLAMWFLSRIVIFWSGVANNICHFNLLV
ncbi:hypothetical protein A2U01_0083274, partial [Trifolium medium]|nr:hypothetical protein [Trifolium medium]